MSVAANQRVTARFNKTADRETKLALVRDMIDRLRPRITASAAHDQSLQRAALGAQSVHDHVSAMLGAKVARTGWTPEHRLAASALEAMQHQLDMVLRSGYVPPAEKQRVCLEHALCRAEDALGLLAGRQ